MTNIATYKGSILDCDVDVIVNPANSFLMNGAGLAGVIQRAAYGSGSPEARLQVALENSDEELEIEARAQIQYGKEVKAAKLIPYGDAILTSAGALPHPYGIIHAVGPIWGGGEFYERALLNRAYTRCLEIAHEAGFQSIAFPAISAGIFGVPINVVASEAVLAVRTWKQSELDALGALDVTFALMDDEHVARFQQSIDYGDKMWKRSA